MPFGFSSSGSFRNSEKSLRKMQEMNISSMLNHYGQYGVDALARATPQESGATALGWAYRIKSDRKTITLEWYNTNVVDGASVAILIQYDHGTGTGGFSKGFDYINPAMQPVFQGILDSITREVSA